MSVMNSIFRPEWTAGISDFAVSRRPSDNRDGRPAGRPPRAAARLRPAVRLRWRAKHFPAKICKKILQLCPQTGFSISEMSNDQRNQPDESLWRRKLSEAERTELRAPAGAGTGSAFDRCPRQSSRHAGAVQFHRSRAGRRLNLRNGRLPVRTVRFGNGVSLSLGRASRSPPRC